MTVRDAVNNIGGRKFVLATFVIVSATAMRVTGYLSEAAYQAVVLFALGLYAAGNVGARAVTQPSSSPAPDGGKP